MITSKDIARFVEENKEEAIDCLREILQTPSVTGDEEPVSHVFEKWIRACGMEVERVYGAPQRPNLIAEWFGSEPGKRFIFNGHMDVFPPCKEGLSPYDPWGAVVEDGYMYARGASDMKGGDCAALMAVTFLRRMGFDPKGSVVLSYMCDEENGGWLGVKEMVKKGLLKGDFGICMEPTDNMILNQHWGILRMKFGYTAEPHHAGQPHPSIDAMEKLYRAMGGIYELDKKLGQTTTPSGTPCVSVTMVNAGNTPNVQPGFAEMIVDRRIAMHETMEEAKAQLFAIFDALKAEDPAEYDYSWELLSDRDPLNIPADDPFIQLVQRSYEEALGRPGKLHVRSGGSDAATLRAAYGIPMPNMGFATCLDEYGSGGSKERVKLEDYLDSIKVMMMTVVNAMS